MTHLEKSFIGSFHGHCSDSPWNTAGEFCHVWWKAFPRRALDQSWKIGVGPHCGYHSCSRFLLPTAVQQCKEDKSSFPFLKIGIKLRCPQAFFSTCTWQGFLPWPWGLSQTRPSAPSVHLQKPAAPYVPTHTRGGVRIWDSPRSFCQAALGDITLCGLLAVSESVCLKLFFSLSRSEWHRFNSCARYSCGFKKRRYICSF